MKKFELSAYGVEEMNQKEQQNIDGGGQIGYMFGYWFTEAGKSIVETYQDFSNWICE